jgi:hypothetical protein
MSEAKMHAPRRAGHAGVSYVDDQCGALVRASPRPANLEAIKAILLADQRRIRVRKMSEEFTSELSIR